MYWSIHFPVDPLHLRHVSVYYPEAAILVYRNTMASYALGQNMPCITGSLVPRPSHPSVIRLPCRLQQATTAEVRRPGNEATSLVCVYIAILAYISIAFRSIQHISIIGA